MLSNKFKTNQMTAVERASARKRGKRQNNKKKSVEHSKKTVSCEQIIPCEPDCQHDQTTSEVNTNQETKLENAQEVIIEEINNFPNESLVKDQQELPNELIECNDPIVSESELQMLKIQQLLDDRQTQQQQQQQPPKPNRKQRRDAAKKEKKEAKMRANGMLPKKRNYVATPGMAQIFGLEPTHDSMGRPID